VTNPNEEEPVAYLGGQAAEAPPDPPAEEVDGYLGGEASLPALPPAQQSYQTTDFIAANEEPPPPQGADFGAPVEAPPAQEEAAAYDQYAATTDNVQAAADDQYSSTQVEDYAAAQTMTEESSPTTQSEPQPVETSGEFTEPELPKTITQQDAENIIKRITTKKILPPEIAEKEGPRVVPTQDVLTPRSQPGLKTLPIIIVTLFVIYGTAMFFREQIHDAISDKTIRDIVDAALFYSKADEKPPEVIKVEDPPEVKAKKDFVKRLRISEEHALGLNDGELSAPSDNGPGGPKPPGGTTPTTNPGGDDPKKPNPK
jgi:hypothetical protein